MDEGLVVTDGVKEHERLMHAVLQPQAGRKKARQTARGRDMEIGKEKKRVRFEREELGHSASWDGLLCLQGSSEG